MLPLREPGASASAGRDGTWTPRGLPRARVLGNVSRRWNRLRSQRWRTRSTGKPVANATSGSFIPSTLRMIKTARWSLGTSSNLAGRLCRCGECLRLFRSLASDQKGRNDDKGEKKSGSSTPPQPQEIADQAGMLCRMKILDRGAMKCRAWHRDCSFFQGTENWNRICRL